MSKGLKILLILLGVVLLVLIRVYEESLFYDPLLKFFKTEHTTQPLPAFNFGKLLLHTILRFIINSLISLGIIWVIFQQKEVMKFSIVLYGFFLLLLAITFVILLHTSEAGQHLPLFYVRRFLIQPLFLLLLIPAFYLQRVNN
ncbi:MAG: exosortase F system-associated protein [Flavobacteriaceae bacterium]|nr:exosortase F system-associated protein [Flavobacteriaceae bacterium]|tara:strand:- start:191 stop:619 length:429 start_codon:yes stop_codon:yes gene_type:complete